MKTSMISVASALALAACGADDHDGVVWDATATAAGTRVNIPGDRLVLEKDGPGEACDASLPLCGAAQVSLHLAAGDFEIRLTGVSLASDDGAIGAAVQTPEGWALTYYARHGDSEGISVQVPGAAFDDGNGLGERHEAELLLARENDQVGVRGTTAANQATEIGRLGAGPATLVLFVTAFEDSLDDTTSGEFGGRALSGDMQSFGADVIAE